jgi:hypothetical protein
MPAKKRAIKALIGALPFRFVPSPEGGIVGNGADAG